MFFGMVTPLFLARLAGGPLPLRHRQPRHLRSPAPLVIPRPGQEHLGISLLQGLRIHFLAVAAVPNIVVGPQTPDANPMGIGDGHLSITILALLEPRLLRRHHKQNLKKSRKLHQKIQFSQKRL